MFVGFCTEVLRAVFSWYPGNTINGDVRRVVRTYGAASRSLSGVTSLWSKLDTPPSKAYFV